MVIPFITALSYPLRGVKACWGTKELRRLAVIPVLLHGFFFLLHFIIGYTLFNEKMHLLVEMGDAWYHTIFEGALYFLLLLLLAGGSALLSFLLTTLCASSIFEHLSEKTETVFHPDKTQKADYAEGLSISRMIRGIVSELKKMGSYLLILALLLPLHLIPGAGSMLYVILFALSTSFFLAYDYLSHTLSRYGYEYEEMKSFLLKNPSTSFGFGLGCFGLLLIPFASIVIAPATVVGGTLLLHKIGFETGKTDVKGKRDTDIEPT